MYLCLNCQNRLYSTRCSGFGSLMNIDKLIQKTFFNDLIFCFGSLMNIDKLISSISYRGVENPFWLSDEY